MRRLTPSILLIKNCMNSIFDQNDSFTKAVRCRLCAGQLQDSPAFDHCSTNRIFMRTILNLVANHHQQYKKWFSTQKVKTINISSFRVTILNFSFIFKNMRYIVEPHVVTRNPVWIPLFIWFVCMYVYGMDIV